MNNSVVWMAGLAMRHGEDYDVYGIFSTEEKACERVEEMKKRNGWVYSDYDYYVRPVAVDEPFTLDDD